MLFKLAICTTSRLGNYQSSPCKLLSFQQLAASVQEKTESVNTLRNLFDILIAFEVGHKNPTFVNYLIKLILNVLGKYSMHYYIQVLNSTMWTALVINSFCHNL